MPKINTSVPIERLEQQLQVFEQFLWACNLHAIAAQKVGMTPIVPYAGPVIYRDEFRDHLLKIRTMADYDLQRFAFTDKQRKDMWPVFSNFERFGFGLACWTIHSRRVYHVSEDLQAMLAATSLGDRRLSDIRWPFPSFGISLARPISSEQWQRDFDFLLVSPLPGLENDQFDMENGCAVTMLNQRLRVWKPYPHRSFVERNLLGRDRVMEAHLRLQADGILEKDMMLSSGTVLFPKALSSVTIEEVLRRTEPSTVHLWRVVFGLALYLQAKKETAAHVTSWVKAEMPLHLKVPSEPSKKLITNASQVCHVSSVYTLGDTEREDCFNIARTYPSGRTLPFHFREAHGRAPWGKRKALGSAAEKTVWIESVPVRLDLKPAEGVAGGAKVNV
jgi:hypothetical protein